MTDHRSAIVSALRKHTGDRVGTTALETFAHGLDVHQFVDDTGNVDTVKIANAAAAVFPSPPRSRDTPTSAAGRTKANGIDEARRRFGDQARSNAATAAGRDRYHQRHGGTA